MNWLEIIGTAVGLVYLYLEYKASIWLWIAGIVMPAIYVVVYYQAGLYADVGINIYYLLAAFYGLWVWFRPTDKKSDSQNQLGITHLPKKYLPAMAALTLILTVAFALLLDHYLAPGARRCYICIPVLSAITFGLLPFAACFVSGMEALKLAAVGCLVFTVTTWLFTAIQERLSTGPAAKASAFFSAVSLYMAAQCFMGILL